MKRRASPQPRRALLALLCGGLLGSGALALDPPDDPLFRAEEGFNQWYMSRIGLDTGANSAWRRVKKGEPVVVAVIDSGLDWNHLDFDWGNIWTNEDEIPDNGVDDDNNGYVDDLIGYNFIGKNNKPWDHDGHGTFVSGLIAATWNNDVGMAGIDPNARIMVLKALNSFGHSRASYIAEAISYAVDNGAQIINISAGGPEITTMQRAAIDYATANNVLVVIAAGNDGRELKGFGIAAMPEVITVGASDRDDERAAFSNYGPEIDIVAPGVDILSLRARYTDTLRDLPGAGYDNGAAYVGDDRRYYSAGGTSFSAPIVTGAASLILSARPGLTAAELKRMLLNSARDIDIEGRDNFTGAGLLDLRGAITADPAYFLQAEITGVTVVQDDAGQPVVQVLGTANGDRLKHYEVKLGAGEDPDRFTRGSERRREPVTGGVLGNIPAAALQGSAVWILQLEVEHRDGSRRSARFRLQLG